jgi:hypothetical protein
VMLFLVAVLLFVVVRVALVRLARRKRADHANVAAYQRLGEHDARFPPGSRQRRRRGFVR